ncbi:diamine N-acetyltransferase [Kineothrix alysoides]|uniref:Diamine N-acetyltransferase n=1 Tax=Kineothrix alysoides TaxID=1469948 RepID=A0A4R1R216_9FIRM|nr:GNAT family protein [Kineothrix alysoides]TCL59358.1 diamine N-acetyltransferase [Kineothrix alysoides]
MKLRELKREDMAGMLEWMTDPYIRQNFRFGSDKIDEKSVLSFIQNAGSALRAPIEGNTIHYAIADEESDEYLGTISLKAISIANKHAEYAISLRRKAQRKGIAIEATKEILRLAFVKYNLERVYLNVFSDNIPAIKLYEKCGLVLEGEFRNHLVVEGEYKSLKWYSILRTEYQGKYGIPINN